MEASISLEIFRNFRLPKFENRGCVTINFPNGCPNVKIAVRELKNGYATIIFKLR